jgi:uncharacterized protein YbjT (DUF2867 family)
MILVTGASGNVGRPLVAGLLASGVQVRALSRDPAATRWPDGLDVVRGDLSVPDTLAPALEGIDTVFLVWRQLTARDHAAALRVIASGGRRVVYVSSLTVRDDLARQLHPMSQVHAEIEAAIRASGGAWTFLRAAWLATNALGWADEIRSTGTVRMPYLASGRSPIVPEDVAATGLRVLLDVGHDGATYVLTGPERLDVSAMVAAIGKAIDRPLRCAELTPEVARCELIEAGTSEELTDAYLAALERLVGMPEPVTDAVSRITGTHARSFADWAREHADAFR